MTKLAEIADLEKGGASWDDEPRVPAGQPGGGQWTTDGGGARAPHVTSTGSGLPLDDGVYRPGVDNPFLTPVSGGEESEERRIGSNGPPDDFPTLRDIFPGLLRDAPGVAIPLAPIDGFLGFSASANETNLEATMLEYRLVLRQIRAVDPGFVDQEFLPAGGIAGLTWEGRQNLINDLRMQRAVLLYKLRGDVEPLQVETVRFLQKTVDTAYADAVARYTAGRLKSRLSREEAIGNYIDQWARRDLKSLFNNYNIYFRAGGNININNRNYDTSQSKITYRIPDARIENVAFDWTLGEKTIDTPQVRGFFAADSKPAYVIIVRPSQIGTHSTYIIIRPTNLRKLWLMPHKHKPYIPQDIGDLIDILGMIMINSPLFIDKTGYFPGKNIDTVFCALNAGLQLNRERLGEALYLQLQAMSDRMRAHFEADPEDKTDDSLAGRDIIDEMQDLLKQRIRNP